MELALNAAIETDGTALKRLRARSLKLPLKSSRIPTSGFQFQQFQKWWHRPAVNLSMQWPSKALLGIQHGYKNHKNCNILKDSLRSHNNKSGFLSDAVHITAKLSKKH